MTPPLSSGASGQEPHLPAVDLLRSHAGAPDTIVDGVPSCDVPLVWGQAWPLLKRAAIDDISAIECFVNCYAGHAQLWGAWRDGRMIAAWITQLTTDWPACMVVLMAGSERQTWLPAMWDTLRAWARSHGCRAILCIGRPGWRRLLGFRVGGTIQDGRDLMFYPLEGV